MTPFEEAYREILLSREEIASKFSHFFSPKYIAEKIFNIDLRDLRVKDIRIDVTNSPAKDATSDVEYFRRNLYRSLGVSLPPLEEGIGTDTNITEPKIVKTKSLLEPDCRACGGDFGHHKLGCPVKKNKGG